MTTPPSEAGAVLARQPANGTAAARVNLLGMTRGDLQAFFASLGEKPYRASQVMKWIYHAGATDFDAMTDISRKLRERLREVAEIRAPSLEAERRAGDGVVKWLARVGDGRAVETVLIPASPASPGSPTAPASSGDARVTLCISSQVGCALDCSFCATGKQGFDGNLSRADIVGQAWQAARRMAALGSGRAVTNVVFMGMGEPLLNFAPVMDAAEVLMDDLAFGISKRRVTVSTAGVVPRIYDLAARADVSLAVSLHAARDELRDELVPINRKYPIAELLDACRHYLRQVGPRRTVTFEYTLIEGVNDGADDARDLARLLGGLRCKINLIPFNPFPGDARGYRRPAPGRVARFQKLLLERGFAAMLRATRGDDIAAACGQLTGSFRDRTRRRHRHAARAPARPSIAQDAPVAASLAEGAALGGDAA